MAVSFHSLFGLPSAMIRIIRRVIRLRRVSDIQTPLAVYQFDIRSKWTTSITAPHIEGVCVESLHGFTLRPSQRAGITPEVVSSLVPGGSLRHYILNGHVYCKNQSSTTIAF
jgi:hypothetical protein